MAQDDYRAAGSRNHYLHVYCKWRRPTGPHWDQHMPLWANSSSSTRRAWSWGKKQPIMALHFWLSSDNIKRYVLLSVLFISKLFKLPHTSFWSPFQTWGYQYFIYPPAADSWDGHYLVDHLHFPAHFLHNLGWVDQGLRLNCKIIFLASMSIRTFGTLGRRQAC